MVTSEEDNNNLMYTRYGLHFCLYLNRIDKTRDDSPTLAIHCLFASPVNTCLTTGL